MDGFLVFGGVNLKNYCKSRIYQFQILNRWYKPPKGHKEDSAGGFVDEKVQLLSVSVKQKIELIK